MNSLFPKVLFASGTVLLLGTGSITLCLSFYRHESIDKPLIRFAVGTLLFFFFEDLLQNLIELSDQLTTFFAQLGNRDGLRQLILEAMKQSSQAPNPDGSAAHFNIPAAIEQIWRTGVWGVVSVLAECFFLLSSLLLEISREITLQLIWILYPLVIGVLPIFPGVATQFLMHVICVSLWWPLFTLITVVTSVIARHYMAHTNSWGLAILALEVIACLMTCAVPMIAQRLVSGAISQSAQYLSVTSFQSSVSNQIRNVGAQG